MRRAWKPLVCIAVIAATGVVRMPFEAALTRQMRSAKLLSPKPPDETRGKLGQTFWAVSLGGLRTLVATFLNLRAFGAFTEKKWDKVEATYETIVSLAPHTRYYWEAGWHHMTYNASADCFTNKAKPLYRRKDEWRTWIHKGRDFLERGIRNNPDDGILWSDLGFMLTDSNKFVAFRDPTQCFLDAAEAYRRAEETGNALGFVGRARFYALARVPAKSGDALALGRSLYQESRVNHTPSLLSILLALEARENPSMDAGGRAVTLFGTAEKAYAALSNYWRRTNEHLPMNGLALALAELENRLEIPEEKRVSRQPLPPPPDPDRWFDRDE